MLALVCDLWAFDAARPTQCRTFPWWPQHLVSDYDWQLAAADCEGIHISEEGKEKEEGETIPAYSFDDVIPETILHDVGLHYWKIVVGRYGADNCCGLDARFTDQARTTPTTNCSKCCVTCGRRLSRSLSRSTRLSSSKSFRGGLSSVMMRLLFWIVPLKVHRSPRGALCSMIACT